MSDWCKKIRIYDFQDMQNLTRHAPFVGEVLQSFCVSGAFHLFGLHMTLLTALVKLKFILCFVEMRR